MLFEFFFLGQMNLLNLNEMTFHTVWCTLQTIALHFVYKVFSKIVFVMFASFKPV